MGEVVIMEIDNLSLDKQWDRLCEILIPAVQRNETLNMLNVYELVKTGLARLFVAVKEEEIFAAFMVEKVKGMNASYLRVVLAAGEPMRDWISPFVDMMDKLTFDHQALFYELIGRPGWKKALKGIGYESDMIYRRHI